MQSLAPDNVPSSGTRLPRAACAYRRYEERFVIQCPWTFPFHSNGCHPCCEEEKLKTGSDSNEAAQRALNGIWYIAYVIRDTSRSFTIWLALVPVFCLFTVGSADCSNPERCNSQPNNLSNPLSTAAPQTAFEGISNSHRWLKSKEPLYIIPL